MLILFVSVVLSSMDIWRQLFALDKELQLITKRLVNLDNGYAHVPYVFLAGSATEVGMICRSLPTRVFEMEYDAMHEWGEISEEIGHTYLQEVDGQHGYYQLLPSKCGEYLSPTARYGSKIPTHCREEYGNFLQVFRDTIEPVVNTAGIKENLELFDRARSPTHVLASTSEGPSAAAELLIID